ncbi:hypothetical protein M513_14167 [Trichuris suis]|uniref:Uncharacterized protein n=1 Tax=Trichuris suis TaxID=68888 RepID=A0A085LJ10_9BILA|nr:hypothetical protein M513_14167 [Trichuris suis]
MRRIAVKRGRFILPMFPGGDIPFWHALGNTIMKEMASEVTGCAKTAMKGVLKASKKVCSHLKGVNDHWLLTCGADGSQRHLRAGIR